MGVHRERRSLSVVRLVEHYVARQHHAHVQRDLQCRVSQLGIAGSDDAIAAEVDVYLLLQRRLYVDLGERSEALRGERVRQACERVVEADGELAAQRSSVHDRHMGTTGDEATRQAW